jgi:RNA polymerase sigma-70 factor, ECF subfamily
VDRPPSRPSATDQVPTRARFPGKHYTPARPPAHETTVAAAVPAPKDPKRNRTGPRRDKSVTNVGYLYYRSVTPSAWPATRNGGAIMELSSQVGCESIRRASIGDTDSLGRLAESVQQRVYPYIHRVVLDSNLSADLTQDTLVRVLSAVGRLRNVERFWPWVFTIAANTTRQHLRIRRRRREVPISAVDRRVLDERLARADEPAAGAAEEGLGAPTTKAIKRLNRRYQAVLSLRMLEGRSYDEVATRLGCSPGGARCLFLRAKRALRRELSDNELRVSRCLPTGYHRERRAVS